MKMPCASDSIERDETVELDVDGRMLRLKLAQKDEATLARCEEKN
jgi:hypothetical protein